MRFKYYLRGAGIGVIASTLILSIAFLLHDNISDEEVIRRAMKLGMVMQDSASGTLADPPVSDASSADLETDQDPLAEPDQAGSTPDGSGSNPDTGTTPSGDVSDTDTDPSASGSDEAGQPSDVSAGSSADPSDPSSADVGGSTGKPSSDSDEEKKDSKPSADKTKDTDKNKDKEKEKADNKRDEQSDEVEIVIESGDVSRMVSAKVFEAGLVDSADEFNSFLGDNDYDNMLQPGTYKIKKGSSFQQIAKILTKQ